MNYTDKCDVYYLSAKRGIIMKKRMCFAVLARSIDESYPTEVLEGIISQAYALDCDVAVFSMFDENNYVSEFFDGEKNIFNLINPEKFDGFLIPGALFNDSGLRNELFDMLKNTGKPVVSVDYSTDLFPCVLKDERTPFKDIVAHLIDVHGFTDIMCLTGLKDTFQAEERLAAYKDILTEKGLYVREDRCIYGDYWADAAYNLADNIHSGKIKAPQALVCANDRMAMFFVERFTQLGHKVPEEIAVVGYDGIPESRDNVPTICTYKVPDAQVGAEGCAKLYEIITGEKCETLNLHRGFVIRGESCGCLEDNSLNVREMRRRTRREQICREFFRTANMFECLANAPTMNDFIDHLQKTPYIFGAGDSNTEYAYDLCLCKDWDSLEAQHNYIKTGYSKQMLAMCRNIDKRFTFDVSEVFPPLWEERDVPNTFSFFPVHFNNRCLGFSVVWQSTNTVVCGKTFWDWHKALTNGLEFLRTKIYLESLNHITYLNSIKDKLTGIYNRSGYDKYSDEFMQNAKQQGKKFMLISCDMDGLKYINDTFGHLEGDVSLRIIANGLSYACLNNEICARIGGDEFVVIGYGDYTQQSVTDMIHQFEKYLKRYNDANNNEYKVDASVGYVICDIDQDTKLKDILSRADKMMYENKFAKPNRHTRL